MNIQSSLSDLQPSFIHDLPDSIESFGDSIDATIITPPKIINTDDQHQIKEIF